ncbi:MAG: EAL domain-containing protein [Gammaproteobacteria bacterium]|nr:EAL domain-containing protein [Gammaproteobacteria bacterium]
MKTTILCVDDEKMVLMSIKQQLKRYLDEGCYIETADSGEDALEIVKELLDRNIELPVVVADHIMPGMKGDELLKQIHALSPDTLKILLTGQADVDAVGRSVNDAALYRYLSKPWDRAKLGKLVKEAVRCYFDRKKHSADYEHYHKLYHERPSMYFTVDDKGILLSVNQFGAEQFGYICSELEGMPLENLLRESDKQVMREHLQTCLQNPAEEHSWEIRKLCRDGSHLWVRESARAVYKIGGKPTVFIASVDISETQTLVRHLSYQASHDILTGLINRYEFEKRLKRILNTVRAKQTQNALCYLDMDQFKTINDSCGKQAGDELLQQVSGILAEQVRRRDTLARLDGDEFGILMEHCPMEQAMRVVKSIRDAVENHPFLWRNKRLNISVSIGVISITEEFENATEVLGCANAACYAAKDAGRNRIHIYDEEDAELLLCMGKKGAGLSRSLEEDRLRLYFQTIIPAHGPQSVHYELLTRMENGARPPVPASAFLPALKRYNLFAKLDAWVISTALVWLAEHPRHLQRLFVCAINLSSHSLGDREFVKFILRQFDETKVPPDKICFEVTEAAAISNLAGASWFIQALRERGCRLALDDFGTGMFSFSYLANFPVDYLKIDGSFVKNVAADPVSFSIVKSINEIGHAMGKKTVAEFVENATILDKLREIGVDYAQGYHIHQPHPIENLDCQAQTLGTGYA